MSESDDTDLLLLIPPDFFVINSDSEDSIQSLRRSSSDHTRFKELISQVNELEERVNFIESKDNIVPETFSDGNKVNRSVDYSLSFDASNYHSGLGRDLALRFYSLTSAGFRFGNDNGDTNVQSLEPSIANSSANKIKHYTHQTLSPIIDPKCDSSVNYASHVSSSIPKEAILLESSNHYPVSTNNIIEMNYTPGQGTLKCIPSEELFLPHNTFVSSQPYDINFLNEIDEFLENKNRQIGKHLLCNDSSALENIQNLSTDKSRATTNNEDVDSNSEHQSCSKMQSSDIPLCDSRHIESAQRDRLAQIESTHSKTKFKFLFSDAHCNPASCVVEPDYPIGMENCRQECNDHPNLKGKNSKKKNADTGYFSQVQNLDTKKHHRSSLCNPTCSEFIFKSNMGTHPKQPPFSSNSLWESANTGKRYTTCYGESESNSYVNLNENAEKHGCEGQSNPVHSDNLTVNSPSKDNNTMIYENMYHRLNTERNNSSAVKYPPDYNINSLLCDSESHGSKTFMNFGDCVTLSKGEKIALIASRHSPTDRDLDSKLEVNYYKNSKFNPETNSSLHTPFNSESTVETSVTKNYHSTEKEHGQSDSQLFSQKDSNNLLKECGDIQSELPTSNLYKNIDIVSEHVINQTEEKKKMFHRLTNGTSKATRPTFIDDGYYSSTGGGSSATNLLSLSEIWGVEAKELKRREVMTIDQQLEEERCRRKHCENVIQQLQCTILEQQQKLAVAMKVDRSKDYTIQQLQTAWRQLTNHWQELEEQRHTISLQCSEEKEKHQQDMAEIVQKVKWCEVELSKALDLAQGYKEKTEMVEHKMLEQKNSYVEEKNILQISLQEEKEHLLKTKEELGSIQCEIEKMKKKLEAAEKNACDETELSVKANEDVKYMKTLLENLEVDFAVTKEENESLRLRLKEERSRNDVVDQQVKNFKIALDESKKKEKLLQGELIEKINSLDKTKTDLRDYYQQQVEIVVQEKLIEFQTQLDTAELSLHKEMEQKENLALESASKQIKHITEKNLLEVKLLEEKHREELHLCKLQLTHATQQIHKLQAQLQSYSNRKVEIVEKLHTVMETQWQEALRIISGSSPVVHSIQERSLLEKDTSYNIPDRDIKTSNNNINSTVPPLRVPHSSGSSSTTDEIPFSKEDQLTFRANNETECTNDVTSKTNNEDVVKRYIEMLLNRPPGNPLEQGSSYERNCTAETGILEERVLPKWEKVMENQQILQNTEKSNLSCCSTDDSKCTHLFLKDSKSSKPPWK